LAVWPIQTIGHWNIFQPIIQFNGGQDDALSPYRGGGDASFNE